MRTTAIHVVCALFIASVAQHTNAQSIQQWIGWGDAAMDKGEYYGASRFYAGALQLEPGRMLLQWKQAEACRLSHQYDRAADLYDRVYRKDMGRTYPLALRWAGEMQLCDARYAEARITWSKVLQKEKNKDSVIAQRARHALAGCALADTAMSDTLALSHLPGPVNTFDSEFGARPGPDSTLWFSSLRGELNDEQEVVDTANYRIGIYHATRNVGTWNDPVYDPIAGGQGAQQANPFWTPDGQRMFFSALHGDGTSSLLVRSAQGEVVPIAGTGDGYRDTQPTLARWNDRDVLFFASDRSGGSGGMDIWLADLVGNTLSNIRNAGPAVNTPGDEICPYFDAATSTLWFSTDFLPGLGGFDIFMSRAINDVLTSPVNAMQPFNSAANDLYPTYDSSIGEGWFTSNRKGSFAAKGETCCNDIYHVRSTRQRPQHPLLPVQDTAITSKGRPELTLIALQADFPLELYFHNDEPEPRTRRTTTSKTYQQTFEAYRTLFPDYVQRNADTVGIARFFADEVERGRTKLDALVAAIVPVLASGQQVTLDVRGHASPLARNDYNRDLSLRRIESLRNHLAWTDGRVLKSYLDSTAANGGVLRIRVLPFGEDRAVKGVSDDVNDLDRSVYSVEAARERRIEVERVGVLSQPTAVKEWRADLGDVRMGEPHSFQVPMTNRGTAPLKVFNARSSCECVLVQHVPDEIPAGATAELGLFFSGRARPGALHRIITLETNGTPPLLELIIHGNVIE